MLITIKNLTKTQGDRTLLKQAQFIVENQDKIGIIGKNGAGKSTLLKILSGIEPIDQGEIIKGANASISYLAQNDQFDENLTCYQVIEKDLPKNHKVKDYEITAILNRLGIQDQNQKIKNLSGGQRKRVGLARALLIPSDLLLLDEPTNHLDQDMILWLEKYLIKYKGALVMVTHDRYFLENVCNRMFEIDHQKIISYEANYSHYLELKEQNEQIQLALDHKRKQFLKKELEWVRAGVQARSTKSKSRLERFEQLSKEEDYVQDTTFDLSQTASRIGTKTIEIDHLSYQINQNVLIEDFTYHFNRFDRVGIIGPNGIGKSTLLNLICQRLTPTSGSIELGQTIRIGYFSQMIQDMDESKRVLDLINERAHYFNTESKSITASNLLEQFLFDKQKQYTLISKLSGGEKRRLFLLLVLLDKPNVLILDEPTNDFDIPTLNVLEDFLDSFKGIVITTSHDRYFLDRVVDKIFAFENHHLVMYNGGYSDYLLKREENKEIRQKKEKAITYQPRRNKLKMTYQEKKEYETIEMDIDQIEKQIQHYQNQMDKVSDHYEEVLKLSNEIEQLEQLLEQKMDRWQYLSELAEKIAKQ